MIKIPMVFHFKLMYSVEKKKKIAEKKFSCAKAPRSESREEGRTQR